GQQRRSDLRKFVFDIALNSRGEKGKRFDKPFHLRICRLPSADLQARSDLWIALGELASGFSQVGQLTAVIFEKILPVVASHVRSSPCGVAIASHHDCE